MQRVHVLAGLLLILLAGFLIRAEAFRWNWFMHGDVIADAQVSASFLRDGSLLTFSSKGSADPAVYVLPPAVEGEQLKLHGPLVPVAAAALTALRGGARSTGSTRSPQASSGQAPTVAEAFVSLKILSLLAGMLIILLAFLIASRLTDATMGLAAAAWTAASFLLIDYAGNGALYTSQAAVYLLWLVIALGPSSLRRTLLLGILSGVAYLITFQSVILLPAGIILLATQVRPWRRFALHVVILIGLAAIVASPWLLHSTVVLGDPFAGHAWNMRYVYSKAGFEVPAGVIPNLSIRDQLSIITGVFHTWLPYNLYYVARKLFLLAPIAFFLFSFGLIDVIFSPPRLRRAFPVLVLLTFHLLLCAGWPIWKFRFFLPLLPLVFILALEHLHHLPVSRAWKSGTITATFASIVLLSALTYRSVPTHTYYYDGALTQDPFHSSEEETYLRRFHLLPSADAQ